MLCQNKTITNIDIVDFISRTYTYAHTHTHIHPHYHYNTNLMQCMKCSSKERHILKHRIPVIYKDVVYILTFNRDAALVRYGD